MSEQAEYETAVPHARRRLALNPLHEPAYQQLMRLDAQMGQQAARSAPIMKSVTAFSKRI